MSSKSIRFAVGKGFFNPENTLIHIFVTGILENKMDTIKNATFFTIMLQYY